MHLLALLPLLPFLFILDDLPATEFDVYGEMNKEYVELYLQIACAYTGGECPERLPTLLVVDTVPGLWGFHYRGTDIIWLTSRCLEAEADQDKCMAVVVHELVHYIVSEQGRFATNICANERFAWEIYNEYVRDIGRNDLRVANWRLGYPRCRGPRK